MDVGFVGLIVLGLVGLVLCIFIGTYFLSESATTQRRILAEQKRILQAVETQNGWQARADALLQNIEKNTRAKL